MTFFFYSLQFVIGCDNDVSIFYSLQFVIGCDNDVFLFYSLVLNSFRLIPL